MRNRIKKLTKEDVRLIGLLEERKVTIKNKVILSLVKEGMSFKEAKTELRMRLKLACIKRAFQALEN